MDLKWMPDELKHTGFEKDIENHVNIHVTNCEKVLIFLHVYIPCLVKCSPWSKSKQMVRLYKRGMIQTSKHLNIMSLVQRLNKITMLIY